MAEQNYTPLNYTPAPMMSTITGPQMGSVYGGQSVGNNPQTPLPVGTNPTTVTPPQQAQPNQQPQQNNQPVNPVQVQPPQQQTQPSSDIAFVGQTSSPDQVLVGLYSGQPIQGTPQAQQDARKRKAMLDAIATKTPQQIANIMQSGTYQQGLQVFKDLQRFYPALYQQVQMMGQKQKSLDFANKVSADIMGTPNQPQVIEPDNIAMLNQDTIDQISSTFGPTAGAMYSVAQQMLGGNPQIQAQQAKYNEAQLKRKQIQQDIDNTDADVRKMLGSEVSDSFVSAYVARQTKDLNRELQKYKDIEDTEFSALQAMRDDALQNIKMIQEGMKFDFQRQQFTFEQEKFAQQFAYQMQQDQFNNQLKLADLQAKATSDRKYDKDAGAYFRTNNGQLEIQQNISGPDAQSGVASRWTSQFSNITRSDPNAPDLDIALPVGTQIPAPMAGTITAINENTPGRNDGNIQVQMRTADGYTMTFNHLDPSILGRLQVGQQINAGDVVAVAGNTGVVKTKVNGEWVTLRDAQGNVPQIMLANGKTAQQMLDEKKGTHLDMRVKGPDGKSLNSQQIQALLSKKDTINYDNIFNMISFEKPTTAKQEEQKFRSIVSSGSENQIKNKLIQLAYNNIQGATAKNDFQATQTLVSSLSNVKSLIQEAQKLGVPTGYLSGKYEDIAQKFGKSTNTEIAKLGTTLKDQLDSIRRARSGAALTEFEEAFYDSIFPSTGKRYNLNIANIDGFLQSREFIINSYLSNAYDPDTANMIMNMGKSTTQQQSGGRAWQQ